MQCCEYELYPLIIDSIAIYFRGVNEWKGEGRAPLEAKMIQSEEDHMKIQSEDDLRQTILERSNDVVSILCDDPSDLKFLDERLNDLLSKDQTQLVVYCPFAPFDHPYNIIDDFFDKLEEGWTGKT